LTEGETLDWYRLAEMLSVPVWKAKRIIPSREFVGWKSYFSRKWTDDHTPEQYYLAQIAQEVRRVLHKKPNQVKLEDMIIPFSFGKEKKKTPKTQEEKEAHIQNSKSAWYTMLGVKEDDNT